MKMSTPKAGAKHELLFNKRAIEASLLNKSSHLAPALSLTKIVTIIVMYFCCPA
jgi:hypothetical protein